MRGSLSIDLTDVLDNATTGGGASPNGRALLGWAQARVEFDAYGLTELGVPDPDYPKRWAPRSGG